MAERPSRVARYEQVIRRIGTASLRLKKNKTST
jgi:hypothetical protein